MYPSAIARLHPLHASLLIGAAGLLSACATVRSTASTELPVGDAATLDLNGTGTSVIWVDGDTFVFADGSRWGTKARLRGVNTLETYGPVHRWGTWDPRDLLEVARGSASVAAAAAKTCTATAERDKYDRLLVDCPDARRELLRTGVGHLYPFDRDADPEDIAIQKEAQVAGRGMWREGVPTEIVTKVDAATAENGWTAANWAVSTSDGASRREAHRDEHAVCDEVCVGRAPATPSCLRFVPYELRYHDRPACLK